jgi:hypothetical protein
MAQPEEEKPLQATSFVVHATRGVIRDQNSRRKMMFFCVLAAMLWLFLGATFLQGFLAARPLWFMLYWLACAWLTIAALLLAIFDLLMTRVQARAADKALRQQYANKADADRTDVTNE